MKLKFNGIVQKKSKGGCSKCGQKSATSYRMMTSKMFILPSGRNVSCIAGREIEVSDDDAKFLLSYQSMGKDGKVHSAFTKVEE